jgi:transposase
MRMFSFVSAEQRVAPDHLVRAIRALVDDVLRDMPREFDGLYARVGRPSIPPERLLRAQLLQIFYSIRSERLLMEQLDCNLLFRWFVGMGIDEPIWAPTVFTKNRDQLLNQEIARSFFRRVVERAATLMSDEHFTVDGTLIEAWASHKGFQRKNGGTGGDGSDSAVNRKRTMHARPRIEPAFGWLKTIARMRKVKRRGLPKVDWLFVFASAAFNLIRLPKLLPRPV